MKFEQETILVTGAAGFIGGNTSDKLLKKGYRVIGIDNLNNYYDVKLKKLRLSFLRKNKNFIFERTDVEDKRGLKKLFKKYDFVAVINLAARAGVRASIEDPYIYMATNAFGNLNLLEGCRRHNIKKFVLASTSSLYAGQKMPFKESLPVNTPISPYAASNKAAEAMCYAYHYLFGIDIAILRYFTVYGPAGRPDMSVYKFINNISKGKPIDVYGDGSQSRDFTYIDDITEGTIKALKKVGYKIINLGGNRPYKLVELIFLIERYLGKKAKIRYLPFHKADMKATWADVEQAKEILGWKAKFSLEEGIKKTVDWYLDYEGQL